MKKFLFLGLFSLTSFILLGCNNIEDLTVERVLNKTVYAQNSYMNVFQYGNARLLFKANSKIPYISLTDGIKLLSDFRYEILNENKEYFYKIEKTNTGYTVSNERNAKCDINKEKQTLTYDDFDLFTNMIAKNHNPLEIVNVKDEQKYLKLLNSNYVKGNAVTIDLNKYSKIDIYENNNEYYLPLNAFNSLFYNVTENYSLAYNFKDLYLMPTTGLTTNVLGKTVLTSLGEKFYEGCKNVELSEDYYDYYYQSLCLDFDVNYGLKDKFSNFDSFITSKNFKEDISNKDIKKADSGLVNLLTHLKDGHTTFINFSPLYDFGASELDKSKANKEFLEWQDGDTNIIKQRNLASINQGIRYGEDTVFVTFDSFSEINEDILYKNDSSLTEEEKNNMLSNTAYLFKDLYRDLTSDDYKNKIKNIVIDLSANSGGNSTTLMYALSILIGEVKVNMLNALSGATGSGTYKADMNTDGIVDENDISLYDKGFNIFFINSNYTFSSANAMAVFAKDNKPKVVMLGEKTGGGPCAVRMTTTPYGSRYSMSSVNSLAKIENNKVVNIDGGIEADYSLTRAQMLDRIYIINNIPKWLKNDDEK